MYILPERVMLSVQQIGREVEVGGEQQPDAIGDLQESGGLILAVKAHGHDPYQYIQEDDPDKREQPPFQREEQDRPDQVDDQLRVIDDLGVRRVKPAPFEHPVRDPHQDVEDAPSDGEEDRRRR